MCDLIKFKTPEFYEMMERVRERQQEWYDFRASGGRAINFPGDQTTYRACDGFFHFTWYGLVMNGDFADDRKSYSEWIKPGCDEYLRKAAEKKIQTEVTVKHRDACFDNFQVTRENQKAFSAAKLFMDSDNKVLVLLGSTGRGKTHLARAIQHELYLDGKKSVFGTADQWHDWFVSTMPTRDARDFEAETKLLNARSRDCLLIVIDDLTEASAKSQFFCDKFQEILDTTEGKILITTNLDKPKLIEKFGDRIGSRLEENSLWVPVIGPDWRKE